MSTDFTVAIDYTIEYLDDNGAIEHTTSNQLTTVLDLGNLRVNRQLIPTDRSSDDCGSVDLTLTEFACWLAGIAGQTGVQHRAAYAYILCLIPLTKQNTATCKHHVNVKVTWA